MVAFCNEPDPVPVLRAAKLLKNAKVVSNAKILAQTPASKIQQTISRAVRKLDYIPQQPQQEMPFLTSTFQARSIGKDRTSCFSGTVFEVVYEGKKEIYGAIAAHTIAGSEGSHSLQKRFVADVYNGKEFVSIPAEIVQLGAPGFLDMALVKFRPEDEKLFTPLVISEKIPTWADVFQTQGFAFQKPIYIEHRIFMGSTPFSIRTNMPWPREDRPGLCGGAVINSSNHLVGIHTGSFYAAYGEPDDIGYSTPARFLNNLVDAYHHGGISKIALEYEGKKMLELNVDEFITGVTLLDENQNAKTALQFFGKFSYQKFKDRMETFHPAYVQFSVNGVFWEKMAEEFILDRRFLINWERPEATAIQNPNYTSPIKTYLYDVKNGTTQLLPTQPRKY